MLVNGALSGGGGHHRHVLQRFGRDQQRLLGLVNHHSATSSLDGLDAAHAVDGREDLCACETGGGVKAQRAEVMLTASYRSVVWKRSSRFTP